MTCHGDVVDGCRRVGDREGVDLPAEDEGVVASGLNVCHGVYALPCLLHAQRVGEALP